MAQEKKIEAIKKVIKSYFNRNQAWLAKEVGMSEAQLSRKMNGSKEWTQEELDKINTVLGTKLKI